jgi:toxoflavin biosynthesis protein ToxD
LCREPADELARIVEACDESIERRWLAGALLALVGDPRITADEPVMIDVPAGVVIRGTSYAEARRVGASWADVGVEDAWILKEVPATTVRVSEFRIAKYLVTNHEWRRFCASDDGESELPSGWPLGVYPIARSNHPVWTVSATAADAYASWLSRRTGRSFRLPSEVEWEYACRGLDGREYPWGDVWDPTRCNTVEAGPLETTPVGMYASGASPFGVLDMAGNVEEYVADSYRPYPGGELVTDDLSAASETGTYRVTRGGSYARFGDLARCARRHGPYPGSIYAVGLRLVEGVDRSSDRGAPS